MNNKKVMLVERDYKGCYERFALTFDEFQNEFPEITESEENWKNSSGSYTLYPLVHIWYCPCIIGDPMWNLFFTDMYWGLSEGDIEDGNDAYIREDLFGELISYI